jgi:hypothetical protein
LSACLYLLTISTIPATRRKPTKSSQVFLYPLFQAAGKTGPLKRVNPAKNLYCHTGKTSPQPLFIM